LETPRQPKWFVAELIGTFTLVFIGAGAGALSSTAGSGLVGVALAHGVALMIIVYTWGAISGAHVNPAVTFGVALAGRMPWVKAAFYWAAQLIGAALAGLLLRYLIGTTGQLGMTLPAANVSPIKAVILEAILTFFLVVTVFACAIAGRNGNAAGLAIGLVLTMDILMGGPLTGASMNPARSFGPALAMLKFSGLWIYVVGPLAGGGLAAVLYGRWFTKSD
jgi:MIP family channel proteins